MRVFILMFLFSILSEYTLAEDNNKDSLKEYYSGEIIVTAKKEPIVLSSTISEISDTELERAGITNLDNALNRLSGNLLRRNSKNEINLYSRGFSQREIAVFYDGIPIYSPSEGLVDIGFIPLAGVGKITHNKGISSSLYGSNTFGGSVNIITDKVKSDNETSLTMQYGVNSTISLENKMKFGDFEWIASGEYAYSEGFSISNNYPDNLNIDDTKINNSGYDRYSLLSKFGYQINDNNRIDALISLSNGDKDVPVRFRTEYPRYWKFRDIERNIISLNYSSNLNDNIFVKSGVYYSGYSNTLYAYDNDTYTTQENKKSFTSAHDDYSAGATLNTEIQFFDNMTTKVGGIFKFDSHSPQRDIGEEFQNYSAYILTFGIEQNVILTDKISAVAGVNYDFLKPDYADNKPLRDAVGEFNGLAGINYAISEKLSIYGNTGRKSRFPTLKEMYSELLGRNVANPDLQAQTAINSEIGFRYSITDNHNLNIALFRSDIKNLIQIVSLGEGMQQFQNIGKAEFSGFEINAENNLRFANLDFGYTYLNAVNKSGNIDDERLENKPEHMLNAYLSKAYRFGFDWLAEISYVSGQYSYFSDTRDLEELNGYYLVNAQIAYKIKPIGRFLFRVNNILDEYYENNYGMPETGRNIILGFNVNI